VHLFCSCFACGTFLGLNQLLKMLASNLAIFGAVEGECKVVRLVRLSALRSSCTQPIQDHTEDYYHFVRTVLSLQVVRIGENRSRRRITCAFG